MIETEVLVVGAGPTGAAVAASESSGAVAKETSLSDLTPGDRLAMWGLVQQYFYGIDHGDVEAIAECFSIDCFYEINVETPKMLRGREQIRETFSQPRKFVASNHSVSHHTIIVDNGVMRGVAYAVAHLIFDRAHADKIAVRGLRYDDEYILEKDKWRISRRVHNPLWQYEAIATPLAV